MDSKIQSTTLDNDTFRANALSTPDRSKFNVQFTPEILTLNRATFDMLMTKIVHFDQFPCSSKNHDSAHITLGRDTYYFSITNTPAKKITVGQIHEHELEQLQNI